MALRSVSARRLHRREVAAYDGRWLHASVFPFFDARGQVAELLVVDWERERLLRAPWARDAVRAPLLGRTRFRRSATPWRSVDLDDCEPLATLWHFDPWWVLREEAFASHPVTPLLKATNCVPLLDRDVLDLRFERDLSAIRSVRRKSVPDAGLQAWDAERLPAQPTPPVGEGRRFGTGRWTLRPAWS